REVFEDFGASGIKSIFGDSVGADSGVASGFDSGLNSFFGGSVATGSAAGVSVGVGSARGWSAGGVAWATAFASSLTTRGRLFFVSLVLTSTVRGDSVGTAAAVAATAVLSRSERLNPIFSA